MTLVNGALWDGDTSFAHAWREAEERAVKAEEDRRRRLAEAAAAAPDALFYDPMPYADARPDSKLYEGTGIGALYGIRGSERFLRELGDWQLVPGSDRP